MMTVTEEKGATEAIWRPSIGGLLGKLRWSRMERRGHQKEQKGFYRVLSQKELGGPQKELGGPQELGGPKELREPQRGPDMGDIKAS